MGKPVTRAPRTYDQHAATQPHYAAAADVSEPVSGFFRHRLRSGGVWGGVRIWFGPPNDPVTAEELDRSWRWQAEFNGEPVDLDRVWPGCTGLPITEPEYQIFVSQARWARENAPQSAWAKPSQRMELLDRRNPLPF